jgi:hypothetical protein
MRTANAARFVDVALPTDAAAAIRATAAAYLAWLSAYDDRVYPLLLVEFKTFVDDVQAVIGTEDAIAYFLDAAPYFDVYVRETAKAVRNDR